MSSLTILNNQHTTRTFGNGQQFSSIAYSNISHKSRLSINESVIRDYQEILNKRVEINNSTGKYITELIKTLRQTFPVRDNKRRYEDSNNLLTNGEKQNNMNKSGLTNNNKQTNNKTSLSLLQKKLKQLTTQQQKYKQ